MKYLILFVLAVAMLCCIPCEVQAGCGLLAKNLRAQAVLAIAEIDAGSLNLWFAGELTIDREPITADKLL